MWLVDVVVDIEYVVAWLVAVSILSDESCDVRIGIFSEVGIGCEKGCRAAV